MFCSRSRPQFNKPTLKTPFQLVDISTTSIARSQIAVVTISGYVPMDAQLPLPTQPSEQNQSARRTSGMRCSYCRSDLDQCDGEGKLSNSNIAGLADVALAGPCPITISSDPVTLCPSSQTNVASVKAESDDAQHDLGTAGPNQGLRSHVSSAQRQDKIALTDETTKHLVDKVLRALLPQYNALEASHNSAAETLCALQRDLLQLRVDRMESKVEQDDSFVSVKQSIDGLEESITSMRAQVDRLIHHSAECEVCTEPKDNQVRAHVCSDTVVTNFGIPYAHSKLLSTGVVQLWNTDEEVAKSICKRKRDDAGCNSKSKRRCTTQTCA